MVRPTLYHTEEEKLKAHRKVANNWYAVKRQKQQLAEWSNVLSYLEHTPDKKQAITTLANKYNIKQRVDKKANL